MTLFYIAICEGKITLTGACYQAQDISTKNGAKKIETKGDCTYPGVCTGCNKYYYNNGERCTGIIISHLDILLSSCLFLNGKGNCILNDKTGNQDKHCYEVFINSRLFISCH